MKNPFLEELSLEEKLALAAKKGRMLKVTYLTVACVYWFKLPDWENESEVGDQNGQLFGKSSSSSTPGQGLALVKVAKPGL